MSNKLASTASTVYRDKFGVNASECRVVLHLAQEPGATGQRISQVIGSDKSLVSRTIRSLQRKKYVVVRADRNDSQRTTLLLTAAGFKLHDRVLKVALEREKLLLSGFNKKDADKVVNLLVRMLENMERVSAYRPEIQPGQGVKVRSRIKS